ncbi:cation-translocating P-type ATPase [Levilactobacillus suantsaii]|uniref:P-type Ca(2+) transporter n=1 Tax=Levilactobacillus suantsaii TaxID=2292255 RepID=A0A4Q0VKC4_9LACO|nr:cation-translocating P-type ATPase [Levilactobacillus suantsaii]RXI79374.1 cation-translocating P-type ATPase [Levilactobacillus suantsaii]
MTKLPLYQQTVANLYQDLQTNDQGLNATEVQSRLDKYGQNALTQQKKPSLLQRFIGQFKDLMIIVLLVAALFAGLTGEVVDAVIILLVVVLNAIFGVFQEAKAEEAIDALKEMAAPNATVRRDGQIHTVKSDELVPGDIVLLEAGDVVPADLRLVEVAGLKVEESALTGESVPVEKTNATLSGQDLGIGDRTNLAYMNSNVTYGRATGVVVATGMQTEVGRIAGMLESADETTTPLQANLVQLGKALTVLILIIAAVVFGLGLWRGTANVVDMLLTAISLAVAAIPEGLPAIVTVTLALGTQRMAKRHALVRKLPAVETLGSTDIIASDKTGTLTQNKMTVEQIYQNGKLVPAGDNPVRQDDPLARVMLLSNDTQQLTDGLAGDPTETALVQYQLDRDYPVAQTLKDYPREAEIPFDSERKLMTTVHPLADGQFMIAVKGAPDELLKRVTQVDNAGEVTAMTADQRQAILTTNHDLATKAIRVLAFAYRIVPSVPTTLSSETTEQDLIFAGLVGMIDPERPEVAQAVAEAKGAGIRPVMITGDHRDTAAAIAQRLGIITKDETAHAVLTGAELDDLDDATFQKQVDQYAVYARVAPEHKVRIVNAWQKRGKVVAMTGDGANDAPALKAADIGIGMGITGTEVAKGASDMVLADDNFATIVVAVEEGRKVFANIQKAIQYLLSANLGEVLTLFMMTMLGWQILAPVHILWINLVTDTLPAIALGVEPLEKNLMAQRPRGRQSNFFSGGVFSGILYQGLLEGLLTLGVYWVAITYPVHANADLAHADALTMAFVTLGLIQLFHAFNSKSIHGSLFTIGIWKNRFFNWAIVIAFVLLGMTILVPGLNGLFHVTALTGLQWGIVIVAAALMVVIVEIVKFCQRRVVK